MINQFTTWVKSHKLTTLLIAVVLWLVWSSQRPILLNSRAGSGFSGINISDMSAPSSKSMEMGFAGPVTGGGDFMMAEDSQAVSTGRMVIQNSDLSLLVKDVPTSRDSVIAKAEAVGGWMVTSSLSRPEESPFAHVIINVPSDQIKPVLDHLRSLSIKVVSENLQGRDITDQYTDLEEHIAILEKTKARYEEIRAQAVKIDDLLTVTRELTNIQNQIDSYKGRLQKLEQQVAMSQIGVYLSTDEIALPYAPDQVFRPAVVFKLAVRALISAFYGIATKAIWIGVFAIIWVPVLLIIRWFYKRNQRLN